MSATTAALLQAILGDPAATDRRLVYADALDDQGEAERAEFVRLQCELAQYGPRRKRITTSIRSHGEDYWQGGSSLADDNDGFLAVEDRVDLMAYPVKEKPNSRVRLHGLLVTKIIEDGAPIFKRDEWSKPYPVELQTRIDALLAAHEPAWLPVRTRRQVEALRHDSVSGWCCDRQASNYACDCLERAPAVTWRRGFVAGVACRLEQWVGCQNRCCRPHPWNGCPHCQGSGMALGPAIMRLHPVTRVETERRPLRWTPDSGSASFDWLDRFSWVNGDKVRVTVMDESRRLAILPGDVFRLLPCKEVVGEFARFDAEQLALDDLSAALLLVARPVSGKL